MRIPMSLAEKTIALLGVLRAVDVQELPPAKRKAFADLCRHVAEWADPSARIVTPRSGVLYDLKSGSPRHE
jgi:hypothetical protein